MEIQTLLAITAIPVPSEETTLRHAPQVVLVQKLAVFPFLAQSAQPMLAYQVIVVRPCRRRDVAVGTRRALRAVAGDMWVGVAEVVGEDCVGEKRVAVLRTVGPGAVEGVMAWRKAQVRVFRILGTGGVRESAGYVGGVNPAFALPQLAVDRVSDVWLGPDAARKAGAWVYCAYKSAMAFHNCDCAAARGGAAVPQVDKVDIARLWVIMPYFPKELAIYNVEGGWDGEN
ncbi:hypothetical protein V493_06843 [Pseudogymnoascus sp. VKM F-4281 (FW-2241)]|nr:hypothetical protein V493_06843 [Pseudogymnoascus sp. VKM F-4281 (FW-2241)]